MIQNNQKNILKESIGFDPNIPLTKDIELKDQIKEKWFQCTHCDFESKSFKAFEQCKKKRHEIITIYIPIEDNTKLSKSNDLIDKTSLKIESEFNLITNRQNKEILMYNGKVYRKDTSTRALIEERTEQIIENCTTHERNEVINKLKARTGKDLDSFDSFPNLLSIDNGILDIETITLQDHTPKHLSTILIPVEYHKPKFEINDETIFEDIEKNLKDTLFWKFLKSSFTVYDEFRREDFESVLEIIASFFIKKQTDEKAFMFLGKGENGKSVLTEYLIDMIGLENVEKIPLQALSEDKYMGAKLVGKMANIFSDLNDSSLRDTGIIKNITSGEGIEVQHKYGTPFVLQPFCNLLFSCNRFPKVNDQSQGFFRRWIIVKWRRNFENDPQRDEHLKDKLKENQEEKNLVFSSLIHLSRLLLKNGKFSHSKKWNETMEEWNANADPLNDFVENFILDSIGNRNVRETYSFYKQVMKSKQERPLSIAQFGKAFKEYFDQIVWKTEAKDDKPAKSERVWLNIDFKPLKIGDYDDE
ncbi:phage-plasmid primase protein [Marine Group I thaumarchaeote SCGC AAA799-N04]|uniref:Phage-plasmid primase protein n=1 Tax=Marine Group I thaumarchaeote SCGC AAA799-N04 TaxID=1502293 RepID=A0A081RPK8_9ARCH|nr:phage-plasmid primase protein [Marine Group I thaumarchaeote SCGC AAA799-N04]